MTQDTSDFVKFLNESPLVVLPGGTGTELQRRGYKTSLPLWSAQANLDAFDLVTEIHRDYFQAGADICVTNTFRTTPYTFRKIDREEEARYAMKRAIDAAREAQKSVANRPTFIAGSFAPLEDCYEPGLVPADDVLAHEHSRQAEWLAEENVDLLLPETVNAVTEARFMAKAASDTGLPFIISFIADSEAKLLDGSPLVDAVAETDMPGRAGVALNCRAIDVMDTAFHKLKVSYDGVIGLYPNGFGRPHDDLGWQFKENEDSIGKYVSTALYWKELGARIIGGCCGTTPAYIRALTTALHESDVALPEGPSVPI